MRSSFHSSVTTLVTPHLTTPSLRRRLGMPSGLVKHRMPASGPSKLLPALWGGVRGDVALEDWE